MAAREILLLGNPQLWQPSAPVSDIHSRETQEIIRDLSETLQDFRDRQGFGRAIAAPQIGARSRARAASRWSCGMTASRSPI
jgi:peptide deformylase